MTSIPAGSRQLLVTRGHALTWLTIGYNCIEALIALAAGIIATSLCAWLSAILLGGLLLNLMWGWWWADPVAALGMVPIIAREGILPWRGQGCCDHCAPVPT